jgi:colanic acid biosynthesis glycosyl transferase WcaI
MRQGSVLVVGLNFPPEPAGIAPYTGGLASALSASGVDVSVITTFPHYPAWSRISRGALSVEYATSCLLGPGG